jgi:uncharacterized membrane protein (UPF0127 family)
VSAKTRVIRNAKTGKVVLARAKWCESFWCHFRGLQLVPRLSDEEGLLFVTAFEGRAHTAIHMFFMLFKIGVIWMDAKGKVVDKQLALPWRPLYTPKAPARYYIEANPSLLDRVQIGDTLRFDEVVAPK